MGGLLGVVEEDRRPLWGGFKEQMGSSRTEGMRKEEEGE